MEKRLDIIYNKKYLVIVPETSFDLYEAFDYTFDNTVLMTKDKKEKKFMSEFINQNNFKRLIFVNYHKMYEDIISSLNKKIKIDFIFTEELASFSNTETYNMYKNTFNLYKTIENATLGLTDSGLYECLKNQKENVRKIILDIPRPIKKIEKDIKNKTIGILNNDNNPYHSYYNELSATKLVGKRKVNICEANKNTRRFLKDYSIKYSKYNDINKIINKSSINLYINFSNNNNMLFLKSMDNEVPCIIGNNTILDKNKYLKNMLVMNSDDDINEIANRIKNIEEDKQKIIKEYEKFRKKYSAESTKTIEEFLGEIPEREEYTNIKESKILVTIVVPVYNNEKLLRKTLNSILEAGIDNMEILIINDGSTDNSEKTIIRYQKSFPKLIRYIKQKNHGIGSVRNIALKEARGKYIASIDSDDTIDIDFFESALEYLEQDVDMVIYDFLTATKEKNYNTSASNTNTNENLNRYESLLYTKIMTSSCNKIIKRELYKNLNIKYIEKPHEDLSTNPIILLKAGKIKYINKDYYRFCIRKKKIENFEIDYSIIDSLINLDERLEKYKDIVNVDVEEFKYYTYAWRIEEQIINQLYKMKYDEILKFVDYINKNLKDIMIDIFENKKYVEMVEKLTNKEKKYIEERNKALRSNKLEQFIKDARKKDKYYEIKSDIIFNE